MQKHRVSPTANMPCRFKDEPPEALQTGLNRYWLVTAPRTASNLLIKMLNLDEQGVRPSNQGGYFFKPSVFVRFPQLFHDGPIDTWPQRNLEAVQTVMQKCLDTLQDHLEASERDGQPIFVKEHAMFIGNPSVESQFLHPGAGTPKYQASALKPRGIEKPTRSELNLTALPDEFLHTWTPTFLIRHPAMMLPSYLRTCLDHIRLARQMAQRTGAQPNPRAKGEPTDLEMSMKWVRSLYDFYADYYAKIDHAAPMIIDADDIMKEDCDLVYNYASRVGLDPAKVITSWEKASAEAMKDFMPTEVRMLSTVANSTGIVKNKIAGDIDIDQEKIIWEREFGSVRTKKLEAWVRAAMPDYWFLHAKRMRA